MKKNLPFFMIALLPYLLVLALLCLFTGLLMDSVFQNNAIYLVLTLLIIYVITFFCSVAVFIISLVKKRKALDVLKKNMIIKLIHIPAYVFIFIIGLACMFTIFTAGITIVLMILDEMTIVISGLIGLGCIIRSLREDKISIKVAVINGILQFVFCADVISSIIIYRTVKATEYDNKHNL